MTTTATSTTKTLNVAGIGVVHLTLEERGEGQPFLVLHGGAGPQSVSAFAQLLSEMDHNRVLAPTHPGFDGTTRPAELKSVAGLAALYMSFARRPFGLEDVTVVGNSVGGWIAVEMALMDSTTHQRHRAPRCGGNRSAGPPCRRCLRTVDARNSSSSLSMTPLAFASIPPVFPTGKRQSWPPTV